ncbi:hypothetical protein [Sinomonas humi]|uniref:Uncharacterized protein n=1 Tax=Sinomonas humi TaxID=1338436 RepID=A0A0B2AJ99_9MICC|nr:hypothetical protein [Sinomonas humi]KHL01901.1 hypothetical protein LK10_14130 [Sinomonas humi]
MFLPSSHRLVVRQRMRGRLRLVAVLAAATFVLAWWPAFGGAVFPLTFCLGIAWFLWRSDFESGRN